jgi:hypothetical protein
MKRTARLLWFTSAGRVTRTASAGRLGFTVRVTVTVTVSVSVRVRVRVRIKVRIIE